MELKTLKYFVAVARAESITRAAEKVPITQPALSRAIQLLEEELGQKLFTREKYPNVRFNLYSGNIEDICYRLDKGLLDFYLTLQSVDVAQYDSLPLPSPAVRGIILRRDDPLAEKKSFTVEDLRSLPLILSREARREEYPKWFGEAFKKFHVVATYNLLYNAAILVREGVGYVVSIDKLVNDAELCFRPLEPALKSTLRFIWRKDRLLTPQAQILLDAMKRLNHDG